MTPVELIALCIAIIAVNVIGVILVALYLKDDD
jgi:hypothetical protein